MKKILIFSAYYEPETAASLYLSTNLYETLASNGYEIELFCPVPTRGVSNEIRKYYKKHKIEKKRNFTIRRISLLKEGKNSIGRAFRYVLMNIKFIFKALVIKADAIFVQSTPPTQGAMAAIIKKIKHIPFIYNLQDVFPDSLVSSGMTKEGGFIWKVGRKIENFTYKNADKIIVISNDMKNNIMKKGVKEGKIAVIYNWVDTDKVNYVEPNKNKLFKDLELNKDNFYVVYAGNLGHSQGIETILETAKKLNSNRKIKFIIFGGGTEFNNVKKKISNERNISLYPLQPPERVPEVYSLGSCSIVSCKKGVGKGAIPSKTCNIMACSSPILLSFDDNTELQRIVEDNNVGLFSEAENYNKLAENIITLFSEEKMLKEMKTNARNVAEKLFSKKECLNAYIKEISNII